MTEESSTKVAKAVTVGISMAGKTTYQDMVVGNKVDTTYTMTIHLDFQIQQIEVPINEQKSLNLKLQLWDIAGQEKFKFIQESAGIGSHFLIVVVDSTRLESCDWNFFQMQINNVLGGNLSSVLGCLVVRTKMDLKDRREVTDDHIKELVESLSGEEGLFPNIPCRTINSRIDSPKATKENFAAAMIELASSIK